jgi:hypothetical protein
MYVHWEDEVEDEPVMLMKVLYKLPSERRPTNMDMVVSSLSELMNFLKREGVTTKSVEYLYVHYSPRGTCDVMELVTVDNRLPGHKPDKLPVKAETNVIPFPTTDKAKDAKTSKPRVRLKATNVEPVVPQISSYLFTAQQA